MSAIVVVYRWHLRPGTEGQFKEGWHRLTVQLHQQQGSLGSRLHKADDGSWVAYAQWPSRERWERAGEHPHLDEFARVQMKEAVAEAHPPLVLTVVDDLLIPLPRLA